MEITKDNYDSMEPIIIRDIENADFLSLDLELTGINPYSNHLLDSPEARYTKFKSTAERYKIIQLGICTWHKEFNLEENKYKYVARPYNIYVFPEDNVGNNFLNCETSAIIFNREHGMDFNKWIHKGVPYLNVKQENNLLETISDNNLNFYNPSDPLKFKNISLFKDEDRNRYNEFCKVFSEFLYSEHKSWMFEKYPKYFIYYVINNLSENMRRRLFFSYEQVEGKSCLMISKLEEHEKKLKIDDIISGKYEELNKKKGVKKLFEAIIKKKSVLVGHNFNLDVLFIISHFGDPLPPTLKEYKELLKKYFTKIYDTKFLFENLSQEIKEMQLNKETTNLELIYTHLKNISENLNMSIEIHQDMVNSYKSNSTAYHEASFDAYVTGCAFLWMTHWAQDRIETHSNKMYLMRSIYSCINITDDESYAIQNAIAYCLKATKQTSDITLQSLLESKYYERIKKIYNLEPNNNALLILVCFDDTDLLDEFESIMSKFTDKFEFYHLHKFKQLLKEEEEKKNDHRKDKNK